MKRHDHVVDVRKDGHERNGFADAAYSYVVAISHRSSVVTTSTFTFSFSSVSLSSLLRDGIFTLPSPPFSSLSPVQKNPSPLHTYLGRRAGEQERELSPVIRDSSREQTSFEMTGFGQRGVEGMPELVKERLKDKQQARSQQGNVGSLLKLH